jgi:hypothetical protein
MTTPLSPARQLPVLVFVAFVSWSSTFGVMGLFGAIDPKLHGFPFEQADRPSLDVHRFEVAYAKICLIDETP